MAVSREEIKEYYSNVSMKEHGEMATNTCACGPECMPAYIQKILEEIPEDDVPLVEMPFEEIPEDDVPLTELPFEDIPEDDVPLVELPFEDLPLAELPYTGDDSFVWIALTLFSALGLAGISLVEKKRKAE